MATLRAPLDKLAQTLNEIPGKLVRTLDAVRQQREEAAWLFRQNCPMIKIHWSRGLSINT